MKAARLVVTLSFFVLCAVVFIEVLHARQAQQAQLALLEASPALQIDRTAIEKERLEAERLKLVERQAYVPLWASVWFLCIVTGIILTVSGITMVIAASWQRLTTFILKIGKNRIPITRRVMQNMNPRIAEGLVVAAQMEAHAPEKAFELLQMLAQLCTKQVNALKAFQAPAPALPALVEPTTFPTSRPLPAVRDVLQTFPLQQGLIAFGEDERGEISAGTWEDLYSTKYGGKPRHGKTTSASFVIGQSALLLDIKKIYLVDPHPFKKDSLLKKIAPILPLPVFRYNADVLEIKQVLYEFGVCLDQRVKGIDTTTQPVILVVDELIMLLRALPVIQKLISKIAIEGASHACFAMFLAQSWTGRDVGGTLARDNFASTVLHKMERNQAQTLIHDPELAKQAPDLEIGQALFCPTIGNAQKLRMFNPSESDFQFISESYQRRAA